MPQRITIADLVEIAIVDQAPYERSCVDDLARVA